MRSYLLTPRARAAIEAVLFDSVTTFGTAAARRYFILLQQRFRDLAEAPRRPGVRFHDIGGGRVGVYHIRHSRSRVHPAADRVGRPRHLVVYEEAGDDLIILALIHETMDRPQALRRIVKNEHFSP